MTGDVIAFPIYFMFTIYKQISNNLLSARESHGVQKMREALTFTVSSFESILGSQLSHETFSDFIYDPDMLFETNNDVYSKSHPDIKITTTGLIDQSLEMVGLTNHKKIASDLKDAVYDLHNTLSLNLADIDSKKKKLLEVLKDIKLVIR